MADPNFHITTPRLYLHYVQPSDLICDYLLALYNSPQNQKANARGPLADREEVRQRIEAQVDLLVRTGYGSYLISLRPDPPDSEDNRPFVERAKELVHIGTVSLKVRQHPQATPIPDVGFGLQQEWQGKGYATEAVVALLEYFEREKGVTEVFGYCNPDNEDSKRMFRRLGFEERGIVKDIKGIGDPKSTDVHPGLVWAKKGMNEDLSVYGLE